MMREDKMICTKEQCNVLEELFVELLRWLVVFCESNCCLEDLCHFKAAKSWIFGGILCLQYHYIMKSSSDFISATERVSYKPGLVNAFNTSFGTVQRHSSMTFLNNQEMSLLDRIYVGHENQGVLYKYLESDFHVSSCIHT